LISLHPGHLAENQDFGKGSRFLRHMHPPAIRRAGVYLGGKGGR
jgi:hypothetical protein